jgi:hypothetical protein
MSFESKARGANLSLDDAIHALSSFFPADISLWIDNLEPEVRGSWGAVKTLLLRRYGKSEEEDQEVLLKKLTTYKQARSTPIEDHCTKWENLLHQLILPISEAKKVQLFALSLYDTQVKVTIATRNYEDLDTAIRAAITIINECQLAPIESMASEPTPEAMDWTSAPLYNIQVQQMYREQAKLRHEPTSNQVKEINATPFSWMLRLYDYKGQPVCGFCGSQHRSLDCVIPEAKLYWQQRDNQPKHNKKISVNATGSQDTEPEQKWQDPSVCRVEIENVGAAHYEKAPTATIPIKKKEVKALMDTGAEISCILPEIARKLRLFVNRNQSIQYSDVNGKASQTLGTVRIHLWGKILQFHVVPSLQHPILIGWNSIKILQGVIDSRTDTVTFYGTKVRRFPLAKRSTTVRVSPVTTESNYIDIDVEVKTVLEEFPQVIAENPKKPRVTHLVEFHVEVTSEEPIYIKPRKMHPDKQYAVDAEVDEMRRNGIVSPVKYPEWGFPAKVVKKSDGSNRLVTDFRRLNEVTKSINFNPVNMQDALQSLGHAKCFSTIDLASGYWQIQIAEKSKKYTTLTCRAGVFAYNVMPFGLKNAPAVFQNLMTQVLGPLLWSCAVCYMDDIIIFSQNKQQHVIDIRQTLQRLDKANLSIKLEKCFFFKKQVSFLGFLISESGVAANPEKIKPILEMPPPENLKGVESLLGMLGVYQRFIKSYAVKTEPIRRLKRKGQAFEWAAEQQKAFAVLQADLANLPNLQQPDFNRPFELLSDAASKQGIAVILCQRDDSTGISMPISFASRSLSSAEKNYSVQEMEALAVYWGIRKFRPYLECRKFTVFSDHSSLQWFLKTKEDKQGRLARWAIELQQFDFDVIYVKGSTNVVADHLSRHPLPSIQQMGTLEGNNWQKEQEEDADVQKLREKVNQGASKSFSVGEDNILYRRSYNDSAHQWMNLKVVPGSLVRQVLISAHDSPFSGHLGQTKTLKRLQSQFWWPTLARDCKQHVKTCLVCQRQKDKPESKALPKDTSGRFPMDRIAMDFFGPLRDTLKGNCYILVVQDTYTKYVELYPLARTDAPTVAECLLNNFITRHGVPKEVLSDNGPPFSSAWLQTLWSQLGANTIFSPAYHASSNGQVERMMRTLRTMVASYCDDKQDWDKWIRHLRWAYNTARHETTKETPHFLLFGRDPFYPLVWAGEEEKSTSELKNHLIQQMREAAEKVMAYVPASAPQAQFKVGDAVLLKTPFAHKPDTAVSRKLQPRWSQPFRVTEELSSSRFNVANSDSVIKNVHADHMKHFFDRTR